LAADAKAGEGFISRGAKAGKTGEGDGFGTAVFWGRSGLKFFEKNFDSLFFVRK
jgi:hypothetical protein